MILIPENSSENVVCKLVAILLRPRYVKKASEYDLMSILCTQLYSIW